MKHIFFLFFSKGMTLRMLFSDLDHQSPRLYNWEDNVWVTSWVKTQGDDLGKSAYNSGSAGQMWAGLERVLMVGVWMIDDREVPSERWTGKELHGISQGRHLGANHNLKK